ncbi:MAG: acylphosphatase [Lachnospiraceae bacterium]|nr:acylphosphatase [Lachnospiraceae bacterium]
MRLFKRGAANGEEGSSSEKSMDQERERKDDEGIRRHFIVSGRVQGVGFRYTAFQVANTYGLTGWVCNCYDGTVEMEVQGPEEMVNTFLKRMKLMNKWMRVEHVEESDRPVINESGFSERY